MATNLQLPALNPLKARSTVAMAVTLAAIIAPGIFGDVDPDAAGAAAGSAVEAISTLVAIGGAIWVWVERRAPNMRLSFRK
ncbi:hypothetical protein [Palleronia sp.]|uniref:hypothetical protein n=1 Tax=Palleronia sp. TaxID=1940284 RepID=UPI0035C7D84A